MEGIFQSRAFPWIAGGGLLVGLYLLFSSSSSASSGGGEVGYAAANLQVVALQAELGAQIEAARIGAASTDAATIASAFTTALSAQYSRDLGMRQISAGVQTARIAGFTARRIESMQQVTNRKAIGAALKTSMIQAATQTHATDVQAATTRDIVHTQAETQLTSQGMGIFSDILKMIPGLG